MRPEYTQYFTNNASIGAVGSLVLSPSLLTIPTDADGLKRDHPFFFSSTVIGLIGSTVVDLGGIDSSYASMAAGSQALFFQYQHC